MASWGLRQRRGWLERVRTGVVGWSPLALAVVVIVAVVFAWYRSR